MSAATAITTGGLAAAAVYAKGFAKRFGGADSRRACFIGRGAEFVAALVVLGLGLALLAGSGASASKVETALLQGNNFCRLFALLFHCQAALSSEMGLASVFRTTQRDGRAQKQVCK